MTMQAARSRKLLLLALALPLAACGGAPPSSGPAPTNASAEYAALPDSVVCIIDRTSPAGLTELPAKVGPSGPVVLENGQIRSLETIHPINVIAGYAGREGWLTRGDPIVYSQRRYVRTGGERRVASNLLIRAGEHMGILLFAGGDDDSPFDALYVPTAPGCIFQAYVREDLLRG
jgi:hypothetical protein